MIFEIGKFYEHPSGAQMNIVAKGVTIGFGETLIAEDGHVDSSKRTYEFSPIGEGEDYSQNWFEISLERFTLCNFDVSEKKKKQYLRKEKLRTILKESPQDEEN
jgi:hypothetical protein